MSHGYPLSLDLEGRRCLVVGGGNEARLRIANLLDAGAEVLVIASEELPGLDELPTSRLRIERRAYREADLDDVWLVVQVTMDAALATTIAAHCAARRLFFCAVDQPENSSYSHLALTRAGSLTLAVGTEGRAPALGRKLREELARLLAEANAAEEVEALAALREQTPREARREVLSRAVADVCFTGSLCFRKPKSPS
jgi:precorrin-2 dehydrogenase / sirohydrochlorin ferrochelatase